MIDIDEQIDYQREPWGNGEHDEAILASLEELKRIKEQNRRMVELMKDAQRYLCLQNDFNSHQCAKRIDAELLKECGE